MANGRICVQRSLLTRVNRQSVGVSYRTFMTTATRRADPVQDLYLRELRAYKPKPVKAGEAEAQVQKFTAPKPPLSPEETSLAGDLQAYETQAVEVEGQAVAGEEAPKEESWFEEDEEEAHPAAH
ncbi:mitochondrial F1F0 ATP synthase subunit Atp14, putative [Talaromyces marneffei ATCC 18224]|uniref:Mitochondrial F1F0 ATP synthase subunit Atp14, putative n=2 Tax=Talaromyces marneffei TaxID=37727 RepID=B6Q1D3_TALMQ|nr:mitochondrial F1F0 ATP synthase subunit Atp14, putative [Talaromyces marneffei ATCC 18224]